MIGHACSSGSDGRAAHDRSRGKPYWKELRIFGECEFHLPLDRTRGRASKLEAKLLRGVYLKLRVKKQRDVHRHCNGCRQSRRDQAKDRARALCQGRVELSKVSHCSRR